MNWRERQALPGPRARFFFASVVPAFADAETGEVLKGLPAPNQRWKFVWPRKGSGHTYIGYTERPRHEARAERPAKPEDFPLVDDLSPA